MPGECFAVLRMVSENVEFECVESVHSGHSKDTTAADACMFRANKCTPTNAGLCAAQPGYGG